MKVFLTGGVFALLALSNANAALINRGGGMIYDSDRNLTWLQDWNYAQSELSDARRDAIIAAVGSVNGHTLIASDFKKVGATYTGQMTWWGAIAWASELEFGGYSDWRLPTALNEDGTGPCHNFNCTGSEVGHIWYTELGNTAGSDVSNRGPFLQFADGNYVTSTEDAKFPGTGNWYFYRGGGQDTAGMGNGYLAVAVRVGDVGASLPEPTSGSLVALASLVLLFRRRMSSSS